VNKRCQFTYLGELEKKTYPHESARHSLAGRDTSIDEVLEIALKPSRKVIEHG
jgi:hypothetical protein